jgi:hypothetical protein
LPYGDLATENLPGNDVALNFVGAAEDRPTAAVQIFMTEHAGLLCGG